MQTIKNPKNSGSRNFFIWAVIFAVVMLLSNILGGADGLAGRKFSFSEFMQKVDAGEVKKVDIKGDDLIGILKDDSQFYTYLPQYPNLVEKLQGKNVEVNAVPLVSKSERIISGIVG